MHSIQFIRFGIEAGTTVANSIDLVPADWTVVADGSYLTISREAILNKAGATWLAIHADRAFVLVQPDNLVEVTPKFSVAAP